MRTGPSFLARYINYTLLTKVRDITHLSTYEKPHGCAEACREESVEGSHRVDVDGVRSLHLGAWRTHGECEP
jgi:hypothetical protein